MNIAKNKAVTIDYTLLGEDGAVLDSSKGQEPLSYIHGIGSLIEGLEAALEGKQASDHVSVDIPPLGGYGMRDESIVFTMPKERFAEAGDLEVGTQLEIQGPDRSFMVTIIGIEGDTVTVDGNHPLAGHTLHFDVDVIGVRDATADELAHGHIHGQDHDHPHEH